MLCNVCSQAGAGSPAEVTLSSVSSVSRRCRSLRNAVFRLLTLPPSPSVIIRQNTSNQTPTFSGCQHLSPHTGVYSHTIGFTMTQYCSLNTIVHYQNTIILHENTNIYQLQPPEFTKTLWRHCPLPNTITMTFQYHRSPSHSNVHKHQCLKSHATVQHRTPTIVITTPSLTR